MKNHRGGKCACGSPKLTRVFEVRNIVELAFNEHLNNPRKLVSRKRVEKPRLWEESKTVSEILRCDGSDVVSAKGVHSRPADSNY